MSVLAKDVMGYNVSDVYNNLTALGLQVEAVPGSTLSSSDARVLTVYDATPLGTLHKGDHIRITYYVSASEDPNQPSDSPTPTPTQ